MCNIVFVKIIQIVHYTNTWYLMLSLSFTHSPSLPLVLSLPLSHSLICLLLSIYKYPTPFLSYHSLSQLPFSLIILSLSPYLSLSPSPPSLSLSLSFFFSVCKSLSHEGIYFTLWGVNIMLDLP